MVTCERLPHVTGLVPPSSLDAMQPHASGVPPEGQRRKTCITESPVAPTESGNAGLAHDEMRSVPPVAKPLRSIEYRSVPVGAAWMVVYSPSGQLDWLPHAEAAGRGMRLGKEPLRPAPARIGTPLSTVPHEGAGVDVAEGVAVRDAVTVIEAVSVGEVETDAPVDSVAEGVGVAELDSVTELVCVAFGVLALVPVIIGVTDADKPGPLVRVLVGENGVIVDVDVPDGCPATPPASSSTARKLKRERGDMLTIR